MMKHSIINNLDNASDCHADISAAWLAGFIDGEGCFCVGFYSREYKGRKNIRFECKVQLKLCADSFWVIEAVHQFLECGKVYRHAKTGEGWWQTTRLCEAISVTELLVPHLILKRSIAERFLVACKLLPQTRKGIDLGGGQRAIDYETACKVTDIALTLNKGGRSYRYRNPRAVEEWRVKLREVYQT